MGKANEKRERVRASLLERFEGRAGWRACRGGSPWRNLHARFYAAGVHYDDVVGYLQGSYEPGAYATIMRETPAHRLLVIDHYTEPKDAQ